MTDFKISIEFKEEIHKSSRRIRTFKRMRRNSKNLKRIKININRFKIFQKLWINSSAFKGMKWILKNASGVNRVKKLEMNSKNWRGIKIISSIPQSIQANSKEFQEIQKDASGIKRLNNFEWMIKIHKNSGRIKKFKRI